MRYLIVDGEDLDARRLAQETADGDDVLGLSEFTQDSMPEIMRFDPDLILVDAASAASRAASLQALVDFASFGRRALVALTPDNARGRKPQWAQYLLEAPYTRARLDRVARLAGYSPSPLGEPAVLRCGDVELNRDERTVHVNARIITLTFTEFYILHELLKHPGRVLSRRELAPALVHPRRPPAHERATAVYIRRIRAKLVEAQTFKIETAQNAGYRCVDTSAELRPNDDSSAIA